MQIKLNSKIKLNSSIQQLTRAQAQAVYDKAKAVLRQAKQTERADSHRSYMREYMRRTYVPVPQAQDRRRKAFSSVRAPSPKEQAFRDNIYLADKLCFEDRAYYDHATLTYHFQNPADFFGMESYTIPEQAIRLPQNKYVGKEFVPKATDTSWEPNPLLCSNNVIDWSPAPTWFSSRKTK